LGGGRLVVGEAVETGTLERHDRLARTEWSVAAPQLGEADRTGQVVATPPGLTGEVLIGLGAFHPSAIGLPRRRLD